MEILFKSQLLSSLPIPTTPKCSCCMPPEFCKEVMPLLTSEFNKTAQRRCYSSVLCFQPCSALRLALMLLCLLFRLRAAFSCLASSFASCWAFCLASCSASACAASSLLFALVSFLLALISDLLSSLSYLKLQRFSSRPPCLPLQTTMFHAAHLRTPDLLSYTAFSSFRISSTQVARPTKQTYTCCSTACSPAYHTHTC